MSTIKVNALQDTSGKGYYPARAWVNYNGSGTVSIRDDDGVSSLTDRGSGLYTINFSNSFSSANYQMSGAANNVLIGGECLSINTSALAMSSSACPIICSRYSAVFDGTTQTASFTQ